MSFDVQNASLVAGGEGVPLKPIELEGLHVTPSIESANSQVTGAGATDLFARHTGGRARIFGVVQDFLADEVQVIDEDNYLASGEAVWFALVIIQHKNQGSVSALWVPGTVAAVASAAKPTFAEIKTFLDLDDKEATFGIAGDIRFHRSADTVIDVATSSERRPAYTDDSKKNGILADTTDPTTLSATPGGYADFAVDLTTASGVGVGNLFVDGADLPSFPYGGRVDKLEYIGAVDGTAGDVVIKAQIDGTEVTGSDLALTAANTAVPSKVDGGAPSAGADFLPGQGLDLEMDTVTAAFTAGSGTIRVHFSEYLPA